MIVPDEEKASPADLTRLNQHMEKVYRAWFAGEPGPNFRRYTNEHQQFFVKVLGRSAVIYSFTNAINLSRPLARIDPIPGA